MSGQGMNYPGFGGQMPSFSNLSQWMGGPGASAGGGNTVMGINPPSGPQTTGGGYAQPGPIMGMPGTGTGFGPSVGNMGPGAGTYHIINGGPQTGTGQLGTGVGGNTGGNVDWHHILGGGGSGPQTGNGPQPSPLAHAIMQLRSQGGGTPGVIGSYATANGGNVNPNPLMSANPMNRFNIPF